MRILQVDKFFYNRGGSSKVFFDTIKGLRERGHEVAEFSMLGGKNLPSEYSKYFSKEIPELKSKLGISGKWRIFRHLFRSKDVEKKLSALIGDFNPEVAHIHNAYHQLSASTFITLHRKNIPTVLTVHDVFPLCPNHSLMKGETLGEDYFKNKPLNCLRYKCIDDKFLPSLAGTLEAYYYKAKIWDRIDRFICPSEFMKNKMVEYGFPESKMRLIRNPFIMPEKVLPLGTKVVYIGRLHAEKGIKIFMEAAKKLQDFEIIVAGTGPEEQWVKNFISEQQLSNVSLVGWVEKEQWQKMMKDARVIVVPSVFLENCSISILEALSYGRIVVASDRGGNPELVINGETGFLCRPEDSDDLARAITEAMNLTDVQVKKVIKKGRELVEKNHDPERYFEELERVYSEIIIN